MGSETARGTVGHDQPLFPTPPLTEKALRDALSGIDPAESVRFDAEFHRASHEALRTGSAVPLHTCLFRWAVFVELRSCRRRADRLRELEGIVGGASDADAARDAAKEAAQMIGEAAQRVGR
ncbi:hypothetical protein ABZ234_25460 [Nocardiopsis sp. NPDC006198]|uniref:FCD domain-containing protein n=1 Tax=Streptomonospora nanhaiensis TaxID=1323731 RepID=A0ABY6YM02_9ACTN|nr:hypothetical protein [Streptomonospora nanhaiensis]WAE73147.1 hypothetical protein OUQ99_29000 [Streptomonospora nanhaiensis]